MTVTETAAPSGRRERSAVPPWDRMRASLLRTARFSAPVLAVYTGLRFLSVLLWIPLAHFRGSDPFQMLKQWDGSVYHDIAVRGYMPIVVSPDGNSYNSAAMFPLYPHAMRLAHQLLGVDVDTAGLVITWIGSLFAAVGIYKVCLRLTGDDKRVSLIVVALWALAPSAVAEWALYPDAVFIALSTWVLLAVLDREWLTAGAVCAVAGLVRPSVAPLIGALGLAALVAVVRRQDGWRPWAGAAIAPLGMLAYLAWLWRDYGQWNAYFKIQKGWGAEFDWGRETYHFSRDVIRGSGGDSSLTDFTPAFVATLLTLGAAIVLQLLMLVNARADRTPLVVLAYTTAGVFLTVTNNQMITSKPRELLTLFPLLLPVAALLAKARTRSLVVCFVLLGLLAGWYAWYIPIMAAPWPL